MFAGQVLLGMRTSPVNPDRLVSPYPTAWAVFNTAALTP